MLPIKLCIAHENDKIKVNREDPGPKDEWVHRRGSHREAGITG